MSLQPTGRRPGPAEEDAEEEGAPGRTAALVVLAVILALVVLSILGGDGDEDAESAPTTTPTSRPTSTTGDRDASPTTSPPALLADGESLDPSFGMALVHGLGDGLTIVDLGTGAESRVPTPSAVAQLAWTGDLLLLRTAWSTYRPADDGSTWQEVALEGWSSMSVRGAMIELGRPGAETTGVATVDSSGTVRTWPVELAGGPAGASPIGVVEGVLVVSTIDGIFLLDQDGEAERIASGVALDVAGTNVLRHSCDEQMACALSVLDVRSGRSTTLPPLPDGRVPYSGSVAVGGEAGSPVVVNASALSGPIAFVLRGEKWVELDDFDVWWGGVHVWAENGSGLVWWDWEERTVRSIGLDGPHAGAVGAVEARGDPQVAHRSDPGSPLALVPLAALPEGWRPG